LLFLHERLNHLLGEHCPVEQTEATCLHTYRTGSTTS
jgi:hypothetical protein